MDLTDAQWAVLHPLLPRPRIRRDRRGRPWRDPRDVLNGILWILRTGAPWADLPARYPSPKTCHRRFQHWRADGTLEAVLRACASTPKFASRRVERRVARGDACCEKSRPVSGQLKSDAVESMLGAPPLPLRSTSLCTTFPMASAIKCWWFSTNGPNCMFVRSNARLGWPRNPAYSLRTTWVRHWRIGACRWPHFGAGNRTSFRSSDRTRATWRRFASS